MQGQCFICAKLTEQGEILNQNKSSIVLHEILGLRKSYTSSILERFQKVCYCPECLQRLWNILLWTTNQDPELEETLMKEQKILFKDLLGNCTQFKTNSTHPPVGMLEELRNQIVQEIKKCAISYQNRSSSSESESDLDLDDDEDSGLGSLTQNETLEADEKFWSENVKKDECPGDFSSTVVSVGDLGPTEKIFTPTSVINMYQMNSEAKIDSYEEDELRLEGPTQSESLLAEKTRDVDFSYSEIFSQSAERTGETKDTTFDGHGFKSTHIIKDHVNHLEAGVEVENSSLTSDLCNDEISSQQYLVYNEEDVTTISDLDESSGIEELMAHLCPLPNLVENFDEAECKSQPCESPSNLYKYINHLSPDEEDSESEPRTMSDQRNMDSDQSQLSNECGNVFLTSGEQNSLASEEHEFHNSHTEDQADGHSDKNDFDCHECKASFKDMTHLLRHKEIHSRSGLYKCQWCSAKFNRMGDVGRHEYKRHLNKKMKQPKDCNICGKTFTNEQDCQVHIKGEHRDETGTLYKCNLCDLCYKRPNFLRMHLSNHHQCSDKNTKNATGHLEWTDEINNMTSPDGDGDKSNKNMDVDNAIQMELEVENSSFTSDLHNNEITSQQYPVYNKEKVGTIAGLVESSGIRERSNERGDVISTSDCLKTYVRSKQHKQKSSKSGDSEFNGTRMQDQAHGNVKFDEGRDVLPATNSSDPTHELSIATSVVKKNDLQRDNDRISKSEYKPWSCKCNVCDKVYPNLSDFKLHVLSIHRKDGCFACLECDFTSKWMSRLSSHHIRRHSQQKNFKCDECESSFKELRDLAKHKEIHSRSCLYKCKWCSAKFNRIVDVRRHETIRHLDKKMNQPKDCNICGEKFTNGHDWKLHLSREHLDETGTKYRCNLCDFWGKRSTYLRRHLSIHRQGSGENKDIPGGSGAEKQSKILKRCHPQRKSGLRPAKRKINIHHESGLTQETRSSNGKGSKLKRQEEKKFLEISDTNAQCAILNATPSINLFFWTFRSGYKIYN